MTSPSTYEAPVLTPAARSISPRTVVSSLWLFVVLNYLYCDVLGLYWAEDLNALLSGEIGGLRITQGFLLGVAVLMTIPMGRCWSAGSRLTVWPAGPPSAPASS